MKRQGLFHGLLFLLAYSGFMTYHWIQVRPYRSAAAPAEIPMETSESGGEYVHAVNAIAHKSRVGNSSSSVANSQVPTKGSMVSASSDVPSLEEQADAALESPEAMAERQHKRLMLNSQAIEGGAGQRTHAILQLRNLPPSADSVQALAIAASNDVNVQSRLLAVTALLRAGQSPAYRDMAKDALSRVSMDSDPRVAQRARTALDSLQ